jgi:hypothetical protein
LERSAHGSGARIVEVAVQNLAEIGDGQRRVSPALPFLLLPYRLQPVCSANIQSVALISTHLSTVRKRSGCTSYLARAFLAARNVKFVQKVPA